MSYHVHKLLKSSLVTMTFVFNRVLQVVKVRSCTISWS